MLVGTEQERGPGGEQARRGRGNLRRSRPASVGCNQGGSAAGKDGGNTGAGFDPGGGPWPGSIQRKVGGVGRAVEVEEVVGGLMGG
jgi:hypothetical protein